MNRNVVNVLIVDDEQHVRIMMKRIVKDLGYQVIAEATDGEEAIDLFRETSPDIVLLDINMPVMSGDVALKEIKKINSEACVIILSSITNEETMRICMDLGATCYIKKEYSIMDIEHTIKSAWETFKLLCPAAI